MKDLTVPGGCPHDLKGDDEVTSMLNTDAAAILRLEPNTGVLKYTSWRGFSYVKPEEISLRTGEGYAGRSALERETISVPDLREVERDPAQGPFLEKEGFTTYYAVPLIAKGLVQGVLEIYRREQKEKSELALIL